jgi:hypothetical protein
MIGLTVAVLVNLLPRPNLALNKTHVQLQRSEKDFTMLLRQCKYYAENVSSETPNEARAAIAFIEMLHHRIAKAIKTLKTQLPGTQTELHCTCRPSATRNKLGEWVDQADQLLAPLKSLRTALTERVLGEEHHLYNSFLRESKGIINEETAVHVIVFSTR